MTGSVVGQVLSTKMGKVVKIAVTVPIVATRVGLAVVHHTDLVVVLGSITVGLNSDANIRYVVGVVLLPIPDRSTIEDINAMGVST